jgi:predicted RNA binding protein YcfA (HicA-like mRNA interferase family)
MSNISSYTPKDIAGILKNKGFIHDRSKGSHQVWINPVSGKRVVLPMHKKDLPKGTLYSILKQAGIEKDDF